MPPSSKGETKREHLERMLVFLQTLKELRPKHRIILLSHVDPTSHDCVCEAISNVLRSRRISAAKRGRLRKLLAPHKEVLRRLADGRRRRGSRRGAVAGAGAAAEEASRAASLVQIGGYPLSRVLSAAVPLLLDALGAPPQPRA